MKLESKYEIGQKIWIVYSNKGEVCIYDDTISEIAKNKSHMYYVTETACIELEEDEIIPYENTIQLLEKIIMSRKTLKELELETGIIVKEKDKSRKYNENQFNKLLKKRHIVIKTQKGLEYYRGI